MPTGSTWSAITQADFAHLRDQQIEALRNMEQMRQPNITWSTMPVYDMSDYYGAPVGPEKEKKLREVFEQVRYELVDTLLYLFKGSPMILNKQYIRYRSIEDGRRRYQQETRRLEGWATISFRDCRIGVIQVRPHKRLTLPHVDGGQYRYAQSLLERLALELVPSITVEGKK